MRCSVSLAMKRLNLNARTSCITILVIVAAQSLARDAHAEELCKIPQLAKWKVPSDACILKLRNRPYEASFAANEDVECEGWRAVWNTKDHVHELAEGKNATPPTSFAMKHGCDDKGDDVVCVMALRQLGPITLRENTPQAKTINSPQPFPTICVKTSQGGNPRVLEACVRGNVSWQDTDTPTRPATLIAIPPPSPPPDTAKVNCTTCHVKPFIMSTRHFTFTMIPNRLTDNGTPDAVGNWRNNSVAGQAAIAAMQKVNRIADGQARAWKLNNANPNWKWSETDSIAWFGKNTDHWIPPRGSHVAMRCVGNGCHSNGFPINNHANWTQRGDNRNIVAMGGAEFQDKNYCEHVVGPAFADPAKPITFDNTKFNGGMRALMMADVQRKWPDEQTCRDFWKAIGCEPDATKQVSLVELCKKDKYGEMFQ